MVDNHFMVDSSGLSMEESFSLMLISAFKARNGRIPLEVRRSKVLVSLVFASLLSALLLWR